MSKKIIAIIALSASSLISAAERGHWHLDISSSAHSLALLNSDGSPTPNLAGWMAGATVSYMVWGPLYAGFSSNYFYVAQYSTPKSDNYTGTYNSELEPTLIIETAPIVVKASAFLLGQYQFNKSTYGGNDLAWTNPTGGSIAALWCGSVVCLGVDAVYLAFTRAKIPALATAPLPAKSGFRGIGAVLALMIL